MVIFGKKILKPKELFDLALKDLPDFYSKEEKRNLLITIFEYYLKIDLNKLIINEIDLITSTQEFEDFKRGLIDLTHGTPIQYIIGQVDFLGLTLKVGPGVLIPRPETEELALWASETLKSKNGRIVDIGTGTGCLAIFLKKTNPNLKVIGIDVSDTSLSYARDNAGRCKTEIDFRQMDILKKDFEGSNFECIISNPPYVSFSDKKEMRPNVLDFEPHLALFPLGDDELVFYRRIKELGERILKTNGYIFLEMPEKRAKEISNLFSGSLWSKPIVKQDLNGKERMLMVQFLAN